MPERPRRLRRLGLLAGLLGTVLAAAAAIVALGATPTIEGTDSTASWSPMTAEVSPGGSVTFKNVSTSVPHGVHWETGNPETPSCTNVPIDKGETNWSGSCTFTQAGTYSFKCAVHANMTGTITVSGPAKPAVSTGTGTPTSDTEATLGGSVNPEGQATTYFFNYGTTATYGQKTTEQSAGEGSSSVSKSAAVTGLSPATTYHFQIVAKNASGTSTGADRTFTTPGPPLATTGQATAVSGSGATLQGSVNPDGHQTTYFFNYGTTAAYGQKTTEQTAGSGTTSAAVSAAVTGLSAETTYHFQLVAKNASGTTTGADQAFTTSGPPLATTGQATGITDGEATLQGTVNPKGGETTYFFNYGTTAAYGQVTASRSAGKGTSGVSASATLTGLSPETTYHFQLVAQNSSGTAHGEDQTFTTSSPPPPPPPPPLTPPPVIPPPPAEEGAPLGSAVTVVAGRHGAPLRVSVQVLPPGAGGRLEVDLLIKGGSKVAGRLVRAGVPSGSASYSVALNARAKRALRRKHRLSLIVKVELTPLTGATAVVRRSVLVRG